MALNMVLHGSINVYAMSFHHIIILWIQILCENLSVYNHYGYNIAGGMLYCYMLCALMGCAITLVLCDIEKYHHTGSDILHFLWEQNCVL